MRRRSINATISTQDITVLVDEEQEFELAFSGILRRSVRVTFVPQHAGMVDILPSPILDLQPGQVDDVRIRLLGKSPGHLDVTATMDPSDGELR